MYNKNKWRRMIDMFEHFMPKLHTLFQSFRADVQLFIKPDFSLS